jgi:ribosomal protein L11 methyltransferase
VGLYPQRVPWLLIKFIASDQHADRVSEILDAHGAVSVTIESDDDEQRLQAGIEATPLWHRNRIVGLFPQPTEIDRVLNAVRAGLGGETLHHEVSTLADADWERAWMARYRPIQITPRLWICPSWCTPPDPTAVNLLLDPGLAFGTGTHPTTALCLRWLAEQTLTGRTLIDYGCGSGILAVAALKLGATSAIGVDVDPQALTASRDNAARNDVSEHYQAVAHGDIGDEMRADIVVANILAGTLIEIAPALVPRVKPNGRIALSGLLPEQAGEVRDRYAPYFALQTTQQDGWVLLAGRRLS